MREIFFKKVGKKVRCIKYFIIFVVAKQIYDYVGIIPPYTDFNNKAQSGDPTITQRNSRSVSRQLGWVILSIPNYKYLEVNNYG